MQILELYFTSYEETLQVFIRVESYECAKKLIDEFKKWLKARAKEIAKEEELKYQQLKNEDAIAARLFKRARDENRISIQQIILEYYEDFEQFLQSVDIGCKVQLIKSDYLVCIDWWGGIDPETGEIYDFNGKKYDLEIQKARDEGD